MSKRACSIRFESAPSQRRTPQELSCSEVNCAGYFICPDPMMPFITRASPSRNRSRKADAKQKRLRCSTKTNANPKSQNTASRRSIEAVPTRMTKAAAAAATPHAMLKLLARDAAEDRTDRWATSEVLIDQLLLSCDQHPPPCSLPRDGEQPGLAAPWQHLPTLASPDPRVGSQLRRLIKMARMR
jgi:hypothetical protein